MFLRYYDKHQTETAVDSIGLVYTSLQVYDK